MGFFSGRGVVIKGKVFLFEPVGAVSLIKVAHPPAVIRTKITEKIIRKSFFIWSLRKITFSLYQNNKKPSNF